MVKRIITISREFGSADVSSARKWQRSWELLITIKISSIR